MLPVINVLQGSTRPDLGGLLSLDEVVTVDSVALTLLDADDTAALDEAACTYNPITREWWYDVQPGDYDTVGRYRAHITVKFIDGDLQYLDLGVVQVLPPGSY